MRSLIFYAGNWLGTLRLMFGRRPMTVTFFLGDGDPPSRRTFRIPGERVEMFRWVSEARREIASAEFSYAPGD